MPDDDISITNSFIMKYIIIYTALISLCALGAGCEHGNTIVVNDGKNYLEIRYEGDIKFTEDETAIESISPGGYLKFRNNEQKLYAKSNYHGGVQYELYDEGRRMDPAESGGKKLMAEVIKKMMDVGFNAEERVRHIYEKGGGPALLDATVKVPGDFLKGLYLSYLFSHGDPGDDELIAAAQMTGDIIGSAFEKAQVLKKFPEHRLQHQPVAIEWLSAAATIDADFEKAQVLKEFPFDEMKDPEVAGKWMEVAKTISADYEKSQALKEFPLEKIDDQTVNSKWIEVAKGISADYEKAQVLREFPVNKLNDSLALATWFEAVRTISSDHEKTNTLKILINLPLNNQQFSEVLVTTGGINGDFEQVNLIKELIQMNVPSSPEPFDQLMISVRNIDTDFEKANLLKAIAEKNIETPAQWSGIIQETKAVNADFEKAGVLLLVAQKMPRIDELNSAYMDAAKTIQSEMEYGRVVKAIQ